MEDFILQMEHITKEFSGVKALDDVTFEVKRGEIHALVGENGAGKSTLMKVLSGIYPAGDFDGNLILNNCKQNFKNIKDSEKAGISIIYQELNLVKSMNVCENIFLGDEIRVNGIIQTDRQIKRTFELLKKVNLDAQPETFVSNLGVGKQQLIEIAKALNKNAEIIILDEPTASLTETEVANLMQILAELKAANKTCIYISHKLNEIFEIADRVTVIRDGKTIQTSSIKDLNESKIISLMVGRELDNRFPRVEHKAGEIVLETHNWTVLDPQNPNKNIIDNMNIQVRKGEILGIAGLMGAGRTELALSLFGILKPTENSELYLDNKKVKIRTPREAIDYGISYVSEDRKRFGLILDNDINSNIALSSLKNIIKHGIININKEIQQTYKYVNLLKIKIHSILQKAKTLSGGNQQKVILSKWMLTNPKVLILDEPTRGIDVGAKHEIYNVMNDLINQGVSIIMISSELPEILGMSDRIYIVHEGKINGEMNFTEANQENILYYAAGGV